MIHFRPFLKCTQHNNILSLPDIKFVSLYLHSVENLQFLLFIFGRVKFFSIFLGKNVNIIWLYMTRGKGGRGKPTMIMMLSMTIDRIIN